MNIFPNNSYPIENWVGESPVAKGGSLVDMNWTGFQRVVRNLIGETVVVYVCDESFFGRLAEADSRYLTVASRRGSSAGVHLTYVPFSKVQAISEQ